jgi:hypothetical protein
LATLRDSTQAAIIGGHHDRKSPAETAEARGFGSTMLTAEADAVFDLRRRRDGLREVECEARYRVAEERFCLKLSPQGDGETIVYQPWVEEEDPRAAELRRRVANGESIHSAASALGIPKTTAYRWAE